MTIKSIGGLSLLQFLCLFADGVVCLAKRGLDVGLPPTAPCTGDGRGLVGVAYEY